MQAMERQLGLATNCINTLRESLKKTVEDKNAQAEVLAQLQVAFGSLNSATAKHDELVSHMAKHFIPLLQKQDARLDAQLAANNAQLFKSLKSEICSLRSALAPVALQDEGGPARLLLRLHLPR